MVNYKVRIVKPYTLMNKPSTEVVFMTERRVVKGDITMEMEGFGKGSGRIIDRMDLESIRIRKVLLLRGIGLMGLRVMIGCLDESDINSFSLS